MAIVKERGTITFMSDVQSGVSQSGNPWYRQTIVIDVAGFNGSYRKVALQASGNVVGDLQQMQIGDKVEFSYQVSAREWQGKWYNNVDLFKIDFVDEQSQMQQPQPQVNPQMYPQTPAPAAPAAPAPRGRRVASTPQIPANTPMNLQDGDLPEEIFN